MAVFVSFLFLMAALSRRSSIFYFASARFHVFVLLNIISIMSVDSWTLKVKSLDQTTQSVTVSSSASVLQLKEAIQPVFDVASHRQRLIFQGKVLKDGKQLTEYGKY